MGEIPWAALVSIAVTLLTGAISVGASHQRNARTAKDVEALETKHSAKIDALQARNDLLHDRLRDYELQVEREYTRKSDLAALEKRLVDKVDEIKVDVTKRGIEHAVRNAVTTILAGHVLTAKGKIPEAT